MAQLLIRCDWCENCWDIAHDPDSCTCDTDADWQLIIVGGDDDS
jgi:hypothetical protein